MTAQLAGSGDGSVYAWSVRSGKEVFLGVDSVGYFNCIFAWDHYSWRSGVPILVSCHWALNMHCFLVPFS